MFHLSLSIMLFVCHFLSRSHTLAPLCAKWSLSDPKCLSKWGRSDVL